MNYWAKITGILISGLPHTGQAEIILRNFKAKIQIKLRKEGVYVFFEEIRIDPLQFELYTRGVIDWVTSFGVGFGEAAQEWTKNEITEVTGQFFYLVTYFCDISKSLNGHLFVVVLIFFNLCL